MLALAINFVCPAFAQTKAYSLQYSTHISTPSNYNSINCYGYAIGRVAAVNPGYYSGKSYSNAAAFFNCVTSDLSALGYSVRTVTSPTAHINSNEVMIACFYGSWQPLIPGEEAETNYSFWVKRYNGSPWYHKFGRPGGFLRFKYVPSSQTLQYITNENYNGITGIGSPPSLRASSGSWKYIIFNYYNGSVQPWASGGVEQNA